MHRQLVIIDGPDMTGKSEIAHELEKCLVKYGQHAPYFKNENERAMFGTASAAEYFTNTLRYGMSYMLSYFEQSDSGVIFDRCYPSEWVYTRLFDRPTDHDALQKCDDRFAAIGMKIILTHRSSYAGRSDDSHPELIGSDRLQQLDTLYRKFAAWTKCEVMMLNVDDEDLKREVHDCLRFLIEGKKP